MYVYKQVKNKTGKLIICYSMEQTVRVFLLVHSQNLIDIFINVI